jgi:hypothetical protein
MALNTYAALKTSIGNWLHRDNLSAYTDDFVTIADARIGREVRSRYQQQRSTATIDDYLSLPSDFLAMRSIWLSSGGTIYKLQYLTPDALLLMYPTTTTGTPRHFTIIGDEVRFGPLPSSALTAELWYFKKFSALAVETNDLFLANPDLWLYASLCAATPFLKNDARIAMWEAQYTAVKNQLNQSEDSAVRTSDMQVVAA